MTEFLQHGEHTIRFSSLQMANNYTSTLGVSVYIVQHCIVYENKEPTQISQSIAISSDTSKTNNFIAPYLPALQHLPVATVSK